MTSPKRNTLKTEYLDRGRASSLSATDEDKRKALEHASAFIDTLPFYGKKLHSQQELAWPRSGVFGKDGAPVAGVPREIEEATYIVAGFILAGVPFDADSMAFVFLKIGHLIPEDFDTGNSPVTWH